MTEFLLYLGLFATSMAAGSFLPLPSEAAFVALVVASDLAFWGLLLTATVGNVAGSAINWLLGLGASRFEGRKWFPVSGESLAKARGWYHRYGRWSLLMSWVPIIGDPLTVAAGLMREPLWSFLLIVSVAKFVRYAVLAGVVLNVA
ncbi:MAG: DedA family protein [Rhizobiaceae bacterium]|nr:DedA family protein [Rhizobiaceae bacterium]